jgi:hypothetical protein
MTVATIRLSPQLSRFCARTTSFSTTKRVLEEVLSDIAAEYPGFGEVVLDKEGRIQPYLAVYLNGEPIDTRYPSEIQIPANATVLLLSGVAGG